MAWLEGWCGEESYDPMPLMLATWPDVVLWSKPLMDRINKAFPPFFLLFFSQNSLAPPLLLSEGCLPLLAPPPSLAPTIFLAFEAPLLVGHPFSFIFSLFPSFDFSFSLSISFINLILFSFFMAFDGNEATGETCRVDESLDHILKLDLRGILKPLPRQTPHLGIDLSIPRTQ